MFVSVMLREAVARMGVYAPEVEAVAPGWMARGWGGGAVQPGRGAKVRV